MIISYADWHTAASWSPNNRAMAVRDNHGTEQVFIVWKTNHDEYILYLFEHNTLVDETPFTNEEREEDKRIAVETKDEVAFRKADRPNEFRLDDELRANGFDPTEKDWSPHV